MSKPFPTFQSDEEAEHFVDTADLSEYDFSDFVPVSFSFVDPTAELTLQLPKLLLDTLHVKAAARGMSDDHYIREVLEQAAAH